METWILHHATRTIHRLPAENPELPEHIRDMCLAGLEIVAHIDAGQQRTMASSYPTYGLCPQCEAAMRLRYRWRRPRSRWRLAG